MDGKLIIFSAPSGAGKTSIVKALLSEIPELEFSVSACSRAKRPGETEGVDYYFLTPNDFRKKIEQGFFLEWEEVYSGNFYGTLVTEVDRIWSKGKHVVFDVDVAGGITIKKRFDEKALSIFVMPPSIEELKKRLLTRNTETPESLEKRINKAEQEIAWANQFDHIIVNDKLEKAIVEAKKVVQDFLRKA